LTLTLTTFSVVTTLFLGFWTGNTIPGFKQGSYMGVYAALGTNLSFLLSLNEHFAAGAATALTNFALTYAFVYVQIRIQGEHGRNIDH
jgi:hypothetical protein